MSKSGHALKKGQKLKLKIESIATGGKGFAKHEGISIFVDRGVPGDFVELELYDVRKNFAKAKIINLLEGSNLRQEAPCKLFKVCGACHWQHIKYQNQIELKTDIVKQVIKHIAGLNESLVRPTLAAERDLHYRNKIQFPVSSPNKSSRILAGYYQENSHELVNVKHCPVQAELVDQVMETAKLAAEHAGFSAYKEETHSGQLRHFTARHSFSADEVLFTVVLNAKPDQFAGFASSLNRFAEELMETVPRVIGFCVNFNPLKGNRIMGPETKLVRGREHLVEELKSKHQSAPEQLKRGLKFELSPASFFQVNSTQAVTLMDLVLNAVLDYKSSRQLDSIPLILDAFAGVASIALWVAPLADKVLAVEEVREAVEDAERIIQLNGICNVEPICGTVEELFPKFVSERLRPQIVVLDPPRKGVDEEALKSVIELQCDRIIYVSCEPSTLARDLKILEQGGYETSSIQPVDLFPQTYHVETVSVLDKRTKE
jgi:23S rRNA (uracil1939-C5)-methyltransferase